MSSVVDDWTRGAPRITYQHCPACRSCWAFARSFCPRCGLTPETGVSGGRGTVAAITLVERAPTAALAPLAPYAVLLVDAGEGFRLMAHGERTLAIGDAVRAEFRRFGGTLVPHFVAASAQDPPR